MKFILVLMLLVTSAGHAEVTRTMACKSVDNQPTERWYRLNESWFSDPIIESKINGKWGKVCDTSYMPLNKPFEGSSGDYTFVLTSLTSSTDDMANQCIGVINFTDKAGKVNTMHVMWIIDFERVTYEELRSKTGSFTPADIYQRKDRTCRLVNE